MIRHMPLRFLSLAFAVTGFAGTAAAQTMDFDCPKPGTTFVFDSGTNVLARGREGMDCIMEIVGGKPFKVRGLLFDNPAPDGSDKSAFIAALKPERLWPLAVGKKIEATYKFGGRSWTYILTVARYEKRTGPGDALFDAFVIEMNEQGDKGERSVSRWWVSPVEKYALRFDWSNSTGGANRAIVTTVKH
jgi:hypothetical protein